MNISYQSLKETRNTLDKKKHCYQTLILHQFLPPSQAQRIIVATDCTVVVQLENQHSSVKHHLPQQTFFLPFIYRLQQ